jgi:hypothetical protein
MSEEQKIVNIHKDSSGNLGSKSKSGFMKSSKKSRDNNSHQDYSQDDEEDASEIEILKEKVEWLYEFIDPETHLDEGVENCQQLVEKFSKLITTPAVERQKD